VTTEESAQTPGPRDAHCEQAGELDQPLVIDWSDTQHASLAAAMTKGVAVVSSRCGEMRVLDGCSVPGAYGFMGTTRKDEILQFSSDLDLRANLASSREDLARVIGPQLTAGRTLDVAMALVGKRRTTVRAAAAADLKGGEACEGATHFVRGTFVGAFAMRRGVSSAVPTPTEVFTNAGGDVGPTGNAVEWTRGKLDGCTAGEGKSGAPTQCDITVRLELVQLGSGEGGEEQKIGDAPSCPRGLTFVDGKCAVPSSPAIVQCADNDPKGCQAACLARHVGSCVSFGNMLMNGKVVTQDYRRAAELLGPACQSGSADGCTLMGMLARFGKGTPQDAALSAQLWRRACDAGSPVACVGLGEQLAGGDGVARDDEEAVAVLDRGCAGGLAMACTKLAEALEVRARPGDQERAIETFGRACDAAQYDACGAVGIRLVIGKGVATDRARGLELLRKSCQGGDLKLGCFNLGLSHEKAGEWAPGLAAFERACTLGFTDGCFRSGVILSQGGHGVAKDDAVATERFTRSCDAGEGAACFLVGDIYEATQRPDEAKRAYEKACELGNQAGCRNARRFP